MQHFLSIIVPVYNVSNYLCGCLGSILSQSYSSFECILIDDGSTDGSGAICDEYSRKDSRIRVFHKENEGVSSARNVGLDYASGTWVFFMDSDDLLTSGALELLISHATNCVDMVYGGIQKFNEVEDCLERIKVDHVGEVSIEEALDAFVVSSKRSGFWHRYLFTRIYRMSIIKEFGLRFNSSIHYKEDGLFVVQYLCRCVNKVFCISDIVYLYRQTSNGAMGSLATSYNAKLLTNVDSHGLILQELKQYGVSKDLIERERNAIIQNYYWIASIMKRSGDLTRRNKQALIEKIIKNAGAVDSFYRLVILRYAQKINRKLLCISH